MLHDALRYVRKFHQMSANDVAAAIGVSPSYISEIESGKKRIHEDILEAYSRIFEMPVSSIYLIAESKNVSDASMKGAARRKIAKIIKWIAED